MNNYKNLTISIKNKDIVNIKNIKTITNLTKNENISSIYNLKIIKTDLYLFHGDNMLLIHGRDILYLEFTNSL